MYSSIHTYVVFPFSSDSYFCPCATLIERQHKMEFWPWTTYPILVDLFYTFWANWASPASIHVFVDMCLLDQHLATATVKQCYNDDAIIHTLSVVLHSLEFCMCVSDSV